MIGFLVTLPQKLTPFIAIVIMITAMCSCGSVPMITEEAGTEEQIVKPPAVKRYHVSAGASYAGASIIALQTIPCSNNLKINGLGFFTGIGYEYEHPVNAYERNLYTFNISYETYKMGYWDKASCGSLRDKNDSTYRVLLNFSPKLLLDYLSLDFGYSFLTFDNLFLGVGIKLSYLIYHNVDEQIGVVENIDYNVYKDNYEWIRINKIIDEREGSIPEIIRFKFSIPVNAFYRIPMSDDTNLDIKAGYEFSFVHIYTEEDSKLYSFFLGFSYLFKL